MAFNAPKFRTGEGDPIVPPLLSTTFPSFVQAKGFLQERERAIKGSYKNYGFVNAAFEAMMRQVNWKGGEAWCGYFVKIVYMQMYSFDRAWLAKYITGSANGNLKTVTRLNKAGDNKYSAIYTDTPQVADIFVLELGRSGSGHTGIITDVLGTNSEGFVKVRTLEGNTSLSGNREGEGVFQLTRELKIGELSRPIAKKEPKTMRGYIRRNFTQAEMDNLTYDNGQQTFVFKSEQPTQPKQTITQVLGGLGSQIFKKD